MKKGILLLMALTSVPSFASDELSPLNLDLTDVTVSGLSSGGYMATQFHLAHSDWVKGAGVLAGGPYYCAQNDITTALSQCVNKMDTPVDISALNKVVKGYESAGKIAPLSELKDAKVWLFHGTQDKRVIDKVSDLLYTQYQQWTDTQNIKYVNDKPIAHLFPTLQSGGNCTTSESPFIGNCSYDAAGDMLTHLMPSLTPPDDKIEGTVYTIDQKSVTGDNGDTLAEEAFVFVPQSCANNESCKVHISFHGCNQYADAVGDSYATQTGINAWADDNQLVVLYPQTRKSLFMPLNPQGCWDWWGYASDDYANREGAQISAVTTLLQSLSIQGGNTHE